MKSHQLSHPWGSSLGLWPALPSYYHHNLTKCIQGNCLNFPSCEDLVRQWSRKYLVILYFDRNKQRKNMLFWIWRLLVLVAFYMEGFHPNNFFFINKQKWQNNRQSTAYNRVIAAALIRAWCQIPLWWKTNQCNDAFPLPFFFFWVIKCHKIFRIFPTGDQGIWDWFTAKVKSCWNWKLKYILIFTTAKGEALIDWKSENQCRIWLD